LFLTVKINSDDQFQGGTMAKVITILPSRYHDQIPQLQRTQFVVVVWGRQGLEVKTDPIMWSTASVEYDTLKLGTENDKFISIVDSEKKLRATTVGRRNPLHPSPRLLQTLRSQTQKEA
jgi:hypothetical protein